LPNVIGKTKSEAVKSLLALKVKTELTDKAMNDIAEKNVISLESLETNINVKKGKVHNPAPNLRSVTKKQKDKKPESTDTKKVLDNTCDTKIIDADDDEALKPESSKESDLIEILLKFIEAQIATKIFNKFATFMANMKEIDPDHQLRRR